MLLLISYRAPSRDEFRLERGLRERNLQLLGFENEMGCTLVGGRVWVENGAPHTWERGVTSGIGDFAVERGAPGKRGTRGSGITLVVGAFASGSGWHLAPRGGGV